MFYTDLIQTSQSEEDQVLSLEFSSQTSLWVYGTMKQQRSDLSGAGPLTVGQAGPEGQQQGPLQTPPPLLQQHRDELLLVAFLAELGEELHRLHQVPLRQRFSSGLQTQQAFVQEKKKKKMMMKMMKDSQTVTSRAPTQECL